MRPFKNIILLLILSFLLSSCSGATVQQQNSYSGHFILLDGLKKKDLDEVKKDLYRNGYRKTVNGLKRFKINHHINPIDNTINKSLMRQLKKASNKNIIYYKKIQRALFKKGYNIGAIDGIFGNKTKQAIKQFQRDEGLNSNGEITKETYSALFSEDPKKPQYFFPKYPPDALIQKNQNVFVVDKVVCESDLGASVYLYTGTVTDIKNKKGSVELAKRYKLRYYPDKEGVNETVWYCVKPESRSYCYKQVKFSAWKGVYKKGEIQSFNIKHIVPIERGIILTSDQFMRQKCPNLK